MAKASDHLRQSDVTVWGIVALACVGLAVFGSNISLLVPQSIIGGLHQPRLAGGSIEGLSRQVSILTEETVALRQENEALLARFAVQEKSGGEVIRRVAALEVSMPQLLEDLPASTGVDRSSVTASIANGEPQTFDAEGGSVSVRQAPLPLAGAAPAIVDQPLPEPVEQVVAAAPNQQPYGLAIGAPVEPAGTEALWSDLTLKLGPLLFGYAPLVSDVADGDHRIIVGPINELAEARALCERFERVSIACTPTAYAGEPLLEQ